MQLKLNREFAMRHIGVAVLFAALCGWFAWDGGLAWPAENAAWEKRTGITVGAAAKAHTEERYAHNKEGRDDIPPHWPWEIDRQFQFAGLCGLAALIIGAGVLRCSRQSLVWNDTQMCGSLTDGEPVAFDDIVECDTRKWKIVVNDNGTITQVEAGDVTFTPSGTGHGITNTGDEPLELIALILYEDSPKQ